LLTEARGGVEERGGAQADDGRAGADGGGGGGEEQEQEAVAHRRHIRSADFAFPSLLFSYTFLLSFFPHQLLQSICFDFVFCEMTMM
jgi:hypothetical protein